MRGQDDRGDNVGFHDESFDAGKWEIWAEICILLYAKNVSYVYVYVHVYYTSTLGTVRIDLKLIPEIVHLTIINQHSQLS